MFGLFSKIPGARIRTGCAIAVLMGVPSVSHAVSFTPGSVLDTITTCVPTSVNANAIPGVCVDYVENEGYMRLLVYGYRVPPGANLAFAWEGDFWEGLVRITQGIDDASGGKTLDVAGSVFHKVPATGPTWEYALGGGGENDPLFETTELAASDVLPHPAEFDRYFADWRVSEGPTFFGGATSPNEVGWLLDLEGFHGIRTTNSGDGSGVKISAVPVPASAFLLVSVFGILGSLKRRASKMV